MATVNSLICWGGLTGKTGFSINTSTDQVTLTKHGLMTGLSVYFSAWTTQPNVSGTALALNTRYYPKRISDDVFELYYDSGLTTKVDFTSTGSGLYLKSGMLLAPADLSRWGSTRIYDSIKSMNTARSPVALATDSEIIEIGEAFRDHMTDYDLQLTAVCSLFRITSTINGIRTSAYHGGSVTGGYEFVYSNYNGIALAKYNMELDGFRVKGTVTGGFAVSISKRNCNLRYMIIDGSGSGGSTTGIAAIQSPAIVEYCTVLNCAYGIQLYSYEGPFYIRNNLFTKNNKGFESQYNGQYATYGFIYNNISVGNVTYDWSTQPPGLDSADKNAGSGTSAWMTTGKSRITIATTDFVNHANNDFRPVAANSPQVEVGAVYAGMAAYDIAGREVPDYMNGGAEVPDVGPHEYNHGYGNHPALFTLTIAANVSLSGAEIRIYDLDNNPVKSLGTELSGTESCATSTYSYSGQAGNLVWLQVMQNGYVEYGQEVTLPATNSTLNIKLVAELNN